MQVSVQKFTSTTLAAQPGGAERLGVEPLGRPAERGHVQTLERRHRSDPKAARTSDEKSSGSSQAAKWPPLSTSLK